MKFRLWKTSDSVPIATAQGMIEGALLFGVAAWLWQRLFG